MNISYIKDWSKKEMLDEILHFQEVASLVLPRKEDLPRLDNIDYYGAITPYKGCVGGDHIIVINFDEYHLKKKIQAAKKSNNHTLAHKLEKNLDAIGIMIADVAGHRIGDSVLTNYLHAEFKMGVGYELAYNGEVTTQLLEMMNTDFYNHIKQSFLSYRPFATLIYGELHNDGRFRWLSAGHPNPFIFSNEYDKIMMLGNEQTRSSTPLGIIPSKFNINASYFDPRTMTKDDYSINEITLLGKGDILVLYTDGLIEQDNGKKNFGNLGLEEVLRKNKDKTAKDIYNSIFTALNDYHPPEDDLTIMVIKKN